MKEFFSLRKKSYTLSPHFVKRKAHDRTEKSATEQSGKRGNPRRSSANFCGIRRTRRLLSEEKTAANIRLKDSKARSPNFGSTAAQPALQQARGGKTRVESSPRGKSPKRVSRRSSAASLSKSHVPTPAKPPRQTRIKKVRREYPCPRAIGWRCRTPSRTRFPSAGSRTNERAPPIPLRRGLCPCGRLPIRRRAGRCSRCR